MEASRGSNPGCVAAYEGYWVMPALQGQDKVENPVAIPAQCYLSIILGLHGCKAGLTDLGASASSLETDGLRG